MNTTTTDRPAHSCESVRFLQSSFASEQEVLVSKLKSSQRIKHQGDKGEVNEEYFIEVLRSYLPNRYTVEKAMVIDSLGETSGVLLKI